MKENVFKSLKKNQQLDEISLLVHFFFEGSFSAQPLKVLKLMKSHASDAAQLHFGSASPTRNASEMNILSS